MLSSDYKLVVAKYGHKYAIGVVYDFSDYVFFFLKKDLVDLLNYNNRKLSANMRKFNGKACRIFYLWDVKEDAEKAIEWLNTVKLANKLVE